MVILKGLGYSATFQTCCVCVCVCVCVCPRLDDLQAMNQPVLTFRDPKQPVHVKMSRKMSCTGRETAQQVRLEMALNLCGQTRLRRGPGLDF